jgi:hypothetical protein
MTIMDGGARSPPFPFYPAGHFLLSLNSKCSTDQISSNRIPIFRQLRAEHDRRSACCSIARLSFAAEVRPLRAREISFASTAHASCIANGIVILWKKITGESSLGIR